MVGVQHQNNAINLVKQQKKQYLTEFSKKNCICAYKYVTIFSACWRKLEPFLGTAAVEWVTSLVNLSVRPVDSTQWGFNSTKNKCDSCCSGAYVMKQWGVYISFHALTDFEQTCVLCDTLYKVLMCVGSSGMTPGGKSQQAVFTTNIWRKGYSVLCDMVQLIMFTNRCQSSTANISRQ